jgi:hypothetical protein
MERARGSTRKEWVVYLCATAWPSSPSSLSLAMFAIHICIRNGQRSSEIFCYICTYCLTNNILHVQVSNQVEIVYFQDARLLNPPVLYTTALTRQHVITYSVFNLAASSLTQRVPGYTARKASITRGGTSML